VTPEQRALIEWAKEMLQRYADEATKPERRELFLRKVAVADSLLSPSTQVSVPLVLVPSETDTYLQTMLDPRRKR
jgi:hypothetical protein